MDKSVWSPRVMLLGGLVGLALGIVGVAAPAWVSPNTSGENIAFVLTAPPWCFHFMVGSSEVATTLTYFALVDALAARTFLAKGRRRYVHVSIAALTLVVVHLLAAALAGKLIFGGPKSFLGL